ncbi:FadR/GntR family transcriptional regulator [Gracilibacillus alcaliphilus]|uniref:FadR/GntR family transcriptional regulator n=1 Tax=Gracilibacillus alcaliphilus TaxID=1401441 RepID=UPI0019571D07|nr:FCD domain-containing protein [Gracilibacillus alcaliphilus]MBM7675674.1 DNA-binding FadR family transcriptional regulator [Gracilibacillus alcaliphilus]
MEYLTDKKIASKNKIINIIVDCLKSGDTLPSEKELKEQLDVSRSVLRELLAEFEASGIIVATQGRGREVRFPNVSNSIVGGWNILLRARPETLLELLDIRHMLEKGYLPLAIHSLELSDLQMMRDLINRMEAKAKRGEVFKEEDQLFHKILYSRIENMLLDQLLNSFWEIFEQMKEFHRSENLEQAAALHSEIYEAIVIQDTQQAQDLMEKQFEDVRVRIEAYLDSNKESK